MLVDLQLLSILFTGQAISKEIRAFFYNETLKPSRGRGMYSWSAFWMRCPWYLNRSLFWPTQTWTGATAATIRQLFWSFLQVHVQACSKNNLIFSLRSRNKVVHVTPRLFLILLAEAGSRTPRCQEDGGSMDTVGWRSSTSICLFSAGCIYICSTSTC